MILKGFHSHLYGFLLMLMLSSIAEAAITFTAEKYTHDRQREQIHAVGNVVIQTTDGTLYADEVWIDTKLDIIEGVGHVVLKGQGVKIEAERIKYNIKENTGVFEKFDLTAEDAFVSGKKLERKSVNRYVITDGSYTSCKGSCKDWRVTGSKIDLTIGEYVWIYSALFKVVSVPVMYFPVLMLPAKTERQTGFLFPYFAVLHEVGTQFSFPFYLNLSPHTDVTLTPNWYPKRGLGLQFEHRYMLNTTWQGITYLDTVFEHGFKNFLYGFRTLHTAFFEKTGISTLFKGMSVSHSRYFLEYLRTEANAGTSGLPLILGGHYGPRWLDVSARMIHIQDVLPRLRLFPEDQIYVLPWVEVQTAIWKPLSWLGLSLEASILNTGRFGHSGIDEIPLPSDIVFNANDEIVSAVDATSGLDSNDVIVSALEFGLSPRAHLSLALLDVIKWTAELDFPFRYYVLPSNQDALLFIPEGSHRFSMILERIFVSGELTSHQHRIIPAIEHTYRPTHLKGGLTSFFDKPTEGLDPLVDVRPDHFVSFLLDQDVTVLKKGVYRTLLTFELGWSLHTAWGVDLEPGQVIDVAGPLTSDLAMYFSFLSLFLRTKHRISQRFLTDITSTATFRPIKYFIFSSTFDASGEQGDRSTQISGKVSFLNLFNLLSFSTAINFSFTDRRVQSQTYTLDIIPPSDCWVLSVIANQKIGENSLTFFVNFSLDFGAYMGGIRGHRSDSVSRAGII